MAKTREVISVEVFNRNYLIPNGDKSLRKRIKADDWFADLNNGFSYEDNWTVQQRYRDRFGLYHVENEYFTDWESAMNYANAITSGKRK